MNRSLFKNILLFIICIVGINVLSAFFYARVDFTGDKRFTLSAKTEKMLAASKDPITITVFLGGNMPAPFKRLRNATADLLNDYKAASHVKINLVFEDPLGGVSADQRDQIINTLVEKGIEPTSVRITTDEGYAEKLVFPMAMIETGGRQMPVKLLQNFDATGNYEENINSSIRNLEYIFTSAIRKVQTGINPMIGFTNGNGELNTIYLQDAFKTLSDSYLISLVDLNVISKADLDKLSVLVIAKPSKAFTEAEKYKINYFVMRGGSIVWSIDQVAAELDSLSKRPEQLAFNNELNLDDMLFEYGARINYNLVADANSGSIPLSAGSGAAAQIEPVLWPYYPILTPDTASKLVKNIDGIKSEFISTIDTIAVKGVSKTVILRSSPYSIVYSTPKVISLRMASEQVDPKLFSRKEQSLGVLLEGNFPSVFMNRPVPAGINEVYELPETGKHAKMIVIGDGDIFKNQVSTRDGSVFALGYDRFTQRNYGNRSLLVNIADYLTSDDNLIDLRSKDIKIRLLDKTRLRAEKTYWQLLNICVPIFILIFFAIFQHYYRRHKYAK